MKQKAKSQGKKEAKPKKLTVKDLEKLKDKKGGQGPKASESPGNGKGSFEPEDM
jgi:hypothetical protein